MVNILVTYVAVECPNVLSTSNKCGGGQPECGRETPLPENIEKGPQTRNQSDGTFDPLIGLLLVSVLPLTAVAIHFKVH